MSQDVPSRPPTGASLLVVASALHAILLFFGSLLLMAVGYLAYEITDQMPGIHPAVGIGLMVVGVLNFASVVANVWVLFQALGFRRQGDPRRARIAFWVFMAVSIVEGIVFFIGPSLLGCPVLPILLIPGMILAVMARKTLLADPREAQG